MLFRFACFANVCCGKATTTNSSKQVRSSSSSVTAAATTPTQRQQRSQRNTQQLQQEQSQNSKRSNNINTSNGTRPLRPPLRHRRRRRRVGDVFVRNSRIRTKHSFKAPSLSLCLSRCFPLQPLPQSPCCLLTTATVTFQAASAAAAVEKEICFGAFFFCAPPLHDLFYAHLWCLCCLCLSCRRCCSLCWRWRCRRQQSCLIVFVLFNFCAANASSVCGFFPLWPHFCYFFLVY